MSNLRSALDELIDPRLQHATGGTDGAGGRVYYWLIAPAEGGQWEVAYSEFKEWSAAATVVAKDFPSREEAEKFAADHKEPGEEIVVRDTPLFKEGPKLGRPGMTTEGTKLTVDFERGFDDGSKGSEPDPARWKCGDPKKYYRGHAAGSSWKDSQLGQVRPASVGSTMAMSEAREIQVGDKAKVKDDPREGTITQLLPDGQAQVTYENGDVLTVPSADVQVKDKTDSPADKDPKPEKVSVPKQIGSDGAGAVDDKDKVKSAPTVKEGAARKWMLLKHARHGEPNSAEYYPAHYQTVEDSPKMRNWMGHAEVVKGGLSREEADTLHQSLSGRGGVYAKEEDPHIYDEKGSPRWKHKSKGVSNEQSQLGGQKLESAANVVGPSGLAGTSEGSDEDILEMGGRYSAGAPLAGRDTRMRDAVSFMLDEQEVPLPVHGGRIAVPTVSEWKDEQGRSGGKGWSYRDHVSGSPQLRPDARIKHQGRLGKIKHVVDWGKNPDFVHQGETVNVEFDGQSKDEPLSVLKPSEVESVDEQVATTVSAAVPAKVAPVVESVKVPFEIVAWDDSKLVRGVVPMQYATEFAKKYNLGPSYRAEFDTSAWKWNKRDDTLIGTIVFPDKAAAIRFYEENNLRSVTALPIEKEAVEAVRFGWGSLEAEANSGTSEVVQSNLGVDEAALSTARRNALPDSDFALPDTREYPIDTVRRGRNALARVSQFGTEAEKSTVRAAVHSRYPRIGHTRESVDGDVQAGEMVAGKSPDSNIIWAFYLGTVGSLKGKVRRRFFNSKDSAAAYAASIGLKVRWMKSMSSGGQSVGESLTIEESFDLLLEGQLFTSESAVAECEKIKQGVKAPVVNATSSPLGGMERPSILITVILQPKDEWANGIVHNAKYVRFHLNFTGTLEQVASNQVKQRMRKTRVDSVEEAIEDINRFLQAERGETPTPKVKKKRAPATPGSGESNKFTDLLQAVRDEGEPLSWKFEDGSTVSIDGSTASALLTVYKQLEPGLQAAFVSLSRTRPGLGKLLDFAWKHVKFTGTERRSATFRFPMENDQQMKEMVADQWVAVEGWRADVRWHPVEQEMEVRVLEDAVDPQSVPDPLWKSGQSVSDISDTTDDERAPEMDLPSEEDFEESEIEPEEDDIFIQSDGFKLTVAQGGHVLGTAGEDEQAEKLAKDWMKKNKFWPSVWFVDDHGGIQPYTMSVDKAAVSEGHAGRKIPGQQSRTFLIDPINPDGSLDDERVGDGSYPSGRLTDDQVWDWFFKAHPDAQHGSKEELEAFLAKNKLRLRPVTWEGKFVSEIVNPNSFLSLNFSQVQGHPEDHKPVARRAHPAGSSSTKGEDRPDDLWGDIKKMANDIRTGKRKWYERRTDESKIKDLQADLDKDNRERGTDWRLGGAYGQHELWSGDDERLEAGSAEDCRQAWIRNRFKEKYVKGKPAVSESLVEFRVGDHIKVVRASAEEQAVESILGAPGYVIEQLGPDSYVVELGLGEGKKARRILAGADLQAL